MGVWQARRQDFAAKGANKQWVPHFLNTILDICYNRGQNMQWGARHHWPLIGDDPRVWSDSPLPFSLVSL